MPVIISRTRGRSRRILDPLLAPLALGVQGRRQRLALVVVTATAAIGGFGEAAQMVLLVALAAALTGSEDLAAVSLGPLSYENLDASALLAVGLAVSLATLTLQLGNGWLLARLSTSALTANRRRYFRAYQQARPQIQRTLAHGVVQEHLTNNCQRAATGVLLVGSMLTALVNFLALLISALLVSPFTAGVIVIVVAVLGLVLRPLATATRRYAQRQAQASADYARDVADALTVTTEGLAFGVRTPMRKQHLASALLVSKPYFRSRILMRALPDLYRNLVLAIVIVGLYATAQLAPERVGALGAVLLLLVRALGYSQVLQNNAQKLRENSPYVAVLQSQLGVLESGQQRDGVAHPTSVAPLLIENVSFSYAKGAPSLRGVSFLLPPGKSLAIVGPSGSGKTTLIQILLRMLEPTSGRVVMGGVPLSDWADDALRRQVAFSPQQSAMRRGSVAENISFYRSFTRQELEWAASTSSLLNDIEADQAGFSRRLESGSTLSGGQRQRLALARAVVGRPRLLVLDEPTSSLDSLSEDAVHQALEAMQPETSMIIVAHRPRTVQSCDYILVLVDGRVESFGPKDEVARTSRYLASVASLS